MFMIADEKEMYSRIRIGGTIGFGLAAPIAGAFVQNQGLKAAFWGCAILFFIGFIVSQKLVYGQMKEENQVGGQIRALMKNPRWLLFLIIAFTAGAAMAAFNNYLFPYLKELGASESTMGLALTIGVISEIPILFFGNQLIKRLKSSGLLMLSITVTGLRLLLFAATDLPYVVLTAQILNGLTFPITWVAGVTYADENAPKGMSTTAQGIFSATVLGFGTAAGGFIGGPLLENLGGRSLYFIFGTAVLLITAIVAIIQKSLSVEKNLS
jgi:PPP family 3-phenylpropionic acid transporter